MGRTSPSWKENMSAMIVWLTVLGFLLIILVVAVTWWWLKRRAKLSSEQSELAGELSERGIPLSELYKNSSNLNVIEPTMELQVESDTIGESSESATEIKPPVKSRQGIKVNKDNE